eukprot:gnl/Spiro4/8376_TR4399_c0_g1_i1.p1 gnl/Spiro4/8376_TR4399_c0_g1~~gnl/Spiro4/8376_TR4399_c0_g1_i1.p1  ORF type:complete len:152 (-),score=26.41 gnl/Spiro4/8376_TR4399_c0_g1_i1:47-436(-)
MGVKGSTTSIQVSSNVFGPATATIKPGDTVVWTLVGGTHDVVQTTGLNSCTAASSPSFGTTAGVGMSGSYSFTFNTLGTYYYMCDFHCASSGMKGTIVVSNSTMAAALLLVPSLKVAVVVLALVAVLLL